MSRYRLARGGSICTPAKEQSVNEICTDTVLGCGLNSGDARGNNRYLMAVGNRSRCGGCHNEAGYEDGERSIGERSAGTAGSGRAAMNNRPPGHETGFGHDLSGRIPQVEALGADTVDLAHENRVRDSSSELSSFLDFGGKHYPGGPGGKGICGGRVGAKHIYDDCCPGCGSGPG